MQVKVATLACSFQLVEHIAIGELGDGAEQGLAPFVGVGDDDERHLGQPILDFPVGQFGLEASDIL
jgi:hypothetical protein